MSSFGVQATTRVQVLWLVPKCEQGQSSMVSVTRAMMLRTIAQDSARVSANAYLKELTFLLLQATDDRNSILLLTNAAFFTPLRTLWMGLWARLCVAVVAVAALAVAMAVSVAVAMALAAADF